MKKFKVNYKLTLYLVGLFISFLLIFLSGKFEICRSFGLICLGFSTILYLYFFSDRMKKAVLELTRKLEFVKTGVKPDLDDDDKPLDESEEENEDSEFNEEEINNLTKEEKDFMVAQLVVKRAKLIKNDRRTKILFCIVGSIFIIVGFLLFI